MTKTPLYREDDKLLLGLLVDDTAGWQAQTIFGYTIARAETKNDAVRILHERGPDYLKGVWQYFDTDDRDWYPCIIKQAQEHQVTVIRTNVLGYQDQDAYKHVIIDDPNETNLVKSQ